MLLAETNARLLADGTLRFQILGWRRSHFLLSPWSRGFTALCVRGKQTFPAVAWTVAAVPPAGAACPRNPDVEAFVSEIPTDMCRRVQPYQFGQCILLTALAAGEAVRDLSDSNPNLFWLLAVAVSEGRIRADRIGQLCQLKQTEILRVLTRAGSKAQVRFLRKVRVPEGTMNGGWSLLQAVGNPAIVHVLRHRSDIPIALVQILVAHRHLAREELVPLIAQKAEEYENAGPAFVYRLHRALGLLEFAQAALRAREFRLRLEELLEGDDPPRLLRDARPVSLEEVCNEPATFPPPPLPGSATIIPLATFQELEAEGKAQRHCAGSYVYSVRAGCHYFYRVLAPQRGTLEIELSSGRPELGQFRLAGNRAPSPDAVKAVQEWFGSACAKAAKGTG